MQARRMLDHLHLQMQTAGSGAQYRITAGAAFVRIDNRQTKRATPEGSRGGQIAVATIDHETGKTLRHQMFARSPVIAMHKRRDIIFPPNLQS
jgi:hypothetical protein